MQQLLLNITNLNTYLWRFMVKTSSLKKNVIYSQNNWNNGNLNSFRNQWSNPLAAPSGLHLKRPRGVWVSNGSIFWISFGSIFLV